MAQAELPTVSSSGAESEPGELGRPNMLVGIVAALIGLLAIVFPVAASIGAELTIGVALTAFGIVEFARAFWMRRTKRVLGTALLGLLSLAAGIILVLFPVRGLVSLTIVLIAYFLAGGVVKLISAYQYRGYSAWKWMAVSGAASLVLGVLLWVAMPSVVLWALGVLFGVDLLIFGAAQIAMSRAQAG